MEVGSICLHEEFKFRDGTTGKKFFVVVNSPNQKENYLVCKTTSKEKIPYRVKKQGCSAPEKNYFMFFLKDDWFKQNTWIQFDQFSFRISSFNQSIFFLFVKSLFIFSV